MGNNESGVAEETQQEVAAPVIEETEEETKEVSQETGVEQSVSPADGSEEPIQESADDAGKLAAIKAERDRRQQAETRNQILEQENQQLRQQTPQQQKDPFAGLEDDDVVYVGTVKEYTQGVESRLNATMQQQKIAFSTMMAKQRYEDYDEIIKKLPQMANETQLGIIFASADPAEVAYNFVKGSPDNVNMLTQKAKQEATQQTIDSVNQHLKKPKTLSKVGGGKHDPASKMKNLTDTEINELESAVLMGNQKIIDKYFG